MHIIASFSDVEQGSGPILERLLALNDRHTDVVVVVYRWYGGVKLGGERWRCIGRVASEALRMLEAGETQRDTGRFNSKASRVRSTETKARGGA